jgi:hypothetical protein
VPNIAQLDSANSGHSPAAPGAPRIAFVTSEELASLIPGDRLAADALRERGATVDAAVWTDPAVDWSAYDAIVMRSPWDYARRFREFESFLDRLEGLRAPCFNPVNVMRWNSDKHYLLDLAGAGATVIPTTWVPAAPQPAPKLEALMDERGLSAAVVKPAVAAGGFHTWWVGRADAMSRQTDFEQATQRGDVLVQQFRSDIATLGEWSLSFFGGEYSHSVHKRPARGSILVHAEHGGSIVRATPSLALRQAASQHLAIAQAVWGQRAASGHAGALASLAPWVYARVDGVWDGEVLWLMELELIEPELFFEQSGEAPGRFARALLAAHERWRCDPGTRLQ